MDENTNKDGDDLRMLKNKRKALKGSITKRIAELQRLVSERGSRTKIRFIQDKMNGVLIQMHEVADKVLKITKDYVDEEWMQQETVRADEIAAEIADYLASREGDAPSDENATTASWVEAHSDTRYEPSEISATNFRNNAGVALLISWSMSQIIMGVIYNFVGYWRYMF